MGVERDGLAGYVSYRGVDPSTGAATTDPDLSGANNWITPAPASNVSLVITDVHLSTEAALKLTLYDESGNRIMAFDFAGAGFVQWTPRSKIKLPAGKRLRVQANNTGQVTVLAQYTYENSNVPY